MSLPVVMAFAISIITLMDDGAGPGATRVRVTHHEILTIESCSAWKTKMTAEPQPAVDPVSKRKVASRSFECATIRLPELQEQVAKTIATYR